MKTDPNLSAYHEAPSAKDEFNFKEIQRCRYTLRRLRFLEHKVRESKGEENGGIMHAAMEIEALEWLLTEVGFLDEDRTEK